MAPATRSSGSGWTVIEALAGTTDPKAILAGEGVPGGEQLIDELAGALAAIHRIPLDAASRCRRSRTRSRSLREWHDRLGEPHPAFELAFRALGAQRPAATRRTLVHGDFRMGNLMVEPGGLTGVLDWELAHIGDPVEDLGWLCVPAWRFQRAGSPGGRARRRARSCSSAYERHAGVAVDPAALRWWELAGTLRWGVICVMQAFTHLSGATRSVEHAVIGRRACEVEWDLLELLGSAAGVHAAAETTPRSTARADAPPLHDRPTMLELLEAARGALGEDVLPQLEGRAGLPAAGRAARARDRAARAGARRASTRRSMPLPSPRSGARTSASWPARSARGRSASATRACSRRSATPCARSSRSPTPRICNETEPRNGGAVNDDLPQEIAALIEEIDAFIASEVRPLEAQADNARFFDHRREHAPHGLRERRHPERGLGGAARARWSRAPTERACGDTRCPASSAAATARTSRSRSCASTSIASASACTTIRRARRR